MMGSKLVDTLYAVIWLIQGTGAARCYLQPVLKPSRGVAHAGFNNVRMAELALISQCIMNARLDGGGIATSR